MKNLSKSDQEWINTFFQGQQSISRLLLPEIKIMQKKLKMIEKILREGGEKE